MFWLDLISIVLGSFLQLVFLGLMCRPKSRGKPGKLFYRISALCLAGGASLVMFHAILNRDPVLFVGQLIAAVLFYRLGLEARLG